MAWLECPLLPCSSALPWPPFCRPRPHGRGPPEHSPLSLEGPTSGGTQTMGDNSWVTRRDTLNHAGPASSPANLSHDTQTTPGWGSHVRLQTQRIRAGLACHSRQAEAGRGSGGSRRRDPSPFSPAAQSSPKAQPRGGGRLCDPPSPFSPAARSGPKAQPLGGSRRRDPSPFSLGAQSSPKAQSLRGICMIPPHPSVSGGYHTIPKAQALGDVRVGIFICPPSRNLMKSIVKGKGFN